MIVVDHQAPHTRTEENFRGIAGGRSRIGFNGDDHSFATALSTPIRRNRSKA